MSGPQKCEVIGPLVEFHLTFFNQMNAQWTDEFGRITFAFGHVAGQLRRVHRFRGGKISILAPVVNGGQRQQRENGQDQSDGARSFADFKFVYPFL